MNKDNGSLSARESIILQLAFKCLMMNLPSLNREAAETPEKGPWPIDVAEVTKLLHKLTR